MDPSTGVKVGDLRVGKRFRVIRDFIGYSVGDVIEVVGEVYAPHDAATIWTLRRLSDGRTAHLTELADDHLPMIRELDLYLAPGG